MSYASFLNNQLNREGITRLYIIKKASYRFEKTPKANEESVIITFNRKLRSNAS